MVIRSHQTLQNYSEAAAADTAEAGDKSAEEPADNQLDTAIQELSLRHNREVYPEQPYNAANIVENFENPKSSFGVSESSED